MISLFTWLIILYYQPNRWLHKSPEWFEKEANPPNCSIHMLDDNLDKGYIFPGFGKDTELFHTAREKLSDIHDAIHQNNE